MLRFLWLATRAHRLRPWRSPYLRWRIETYWGIPADSLEVRAFWRFVWIHRRELWRFLCWARAMRREQLRPVTGSSPPA